MRGFWGLLALVPVLVWGQSYTASVRGTVTDPTQAAVPAATVTLTEVNRNLVHKAQTDGAGRYILLTLPPGSYTLAVEAPGFRRYTQPAFQLEVQQQATINVELTVGEVTTTLEVQGAAPLLNTAAATLGQVIENRFIVTMPLSGRNPLALVALTPGVVPAGGAAAGTSGVNFVANGVRNSSADAMLDGTVITGIEQNGGITDVKYTPSVDVIEEFKIQTNFFNAEFGNTGGSIINMVSKSGTNALHGVVYEFRRDNALNANGWFSNRAGGSLTDSKRDIFGATAGAPVVIPKVYQGKSRTFFFVDFEGTRSKSFTSSQQSVPTARQKAGDFSDTRRSNGALYPIYDPYDIYTNPAGTRLRRVFPDNIIPASMINPLSKNMLQFYPEPNREGNLYTRVNNWYAQGVNQSGSNKMDGKIDHHLSDKQRFTSRYSVSWAPTSKPANLIGNMAGTWSISDSRSQNFVFDYTRTHSPSTIMTARLGLLRVRSFVRPGSYGFDSRTVGFPEILRTGGVYQFPGWAASGYMTLGGGQWTYTRRGEHVGQLTGSLTKIAGPHTIKAGAETRRFYENYTQPSFPNGGFAFSRGVTGENPVVSNSNQGDGFASMLLGWGSGSEKWIDSPAATASGFFAIYGQDDWRISSKLTLNLGVRYDFDAPRTDRFNRLMWFDYDAPSPIAGKVPLLPDRELKGIMRYADENNRSCFAGDYNNIQPRIGLAYALGSKMSIRAAYGIFYSAGRHTIKGEVAGAFFSSSSPNWSRDSGYTQYATLQNPFPDGLTPIRGRDPMKYVGFGASIYGRYSKNPQYQQWNFSIQRELPGSGVLEVNYAGSKGTYLYYGTGDLLGNHNKLDPVYWSLGRTVLQRYVPNPFYGIITDPQSSRSLPTVRYDSLLVPYPHYGSLGGYLDPPNIANSSYNSVQFKYEKRFSQGLALLAHYTISKMMGDSDSPGTDIDWLGGAGSIQNWKNLRLERSLSSFDIPQRAIISFSYQLPVGRGKALGSDMHKVLNGFVGGWELSGILMFSSGFPLSVGLASSNLLSGTQRPNLIGDPSTSGPASKRIDGYFNVNAFSQPAVDVYGTAPRMLSNYRRYGVRTGDLTLMKNFAMAERKSLQLRLEAYNFTNTPCFGGPNTSFGGSSFGLITSTAVGARSVQVAVKFYY